MGVRLSQDWPLIKGKELQEKAESWISEWKMLLGAVSQEDQTLESD